MKSPLPKVEKGFAKLGLTWAGVKGEFEDTKDIIGVMATLKSAGLDLDTGLAIFGREASTAALALAGAAFEAHDLEKVLKASEGTSEKMREKMSRGLPGAVDILKSSFEGLQLVLGAAGLTGALQKSRPEWMTDVTNAIAECLAGSSDVDGRCPFAGPGTSRRWRGAQGHLVRPRRPPASRQGCPLRRCSHIWSSFILANPVVLLIVGILRCWPLAWWLLIYYWDDLAAAIRNAWAWLKVKYPDVFQWVEDAWDEALRVDRHRDPGHVGSG